MQPIPQFSNSQISKPFISNTSAPLRETTLHIIFFHSTNPSIFQKQIRAAQHPRHPRSHLYFWKDNYLNPCLFNQETITNDFIHPMLFQNIFPQIFSDYTQINTKSRFIPQKMHTHTPIFKFSNSQIPEFPNLSPRMPLRLCAFARNHTTYYFYSLHKFLEFPKTNPRCAASASSAFPSVFLEPGSSASLDVQIEHCHECTNDFSHSMVSQNLFPQIPQIHRILKISFSVKISFSKRKSLPFPTDLAQIKINVKKQHSRLQKSPEKCVN